MHATVYRVTVANIHPDTAAHCAQMAGLSGTVYAAVGFGGWGIEPGATLEFAAPALGDLTTPAPGTLRHFVRFDLLAERGETCAYVTINGGSPALWYASGEEVPF